MVEIMLPTVTLDELRAIKRDLARATTRCRGCSCRRLRCLGVARNSGSPSSPALGIELQPRHNAQPYND